MVVLAVIMLIVAVLTPIFSNVVRDAKSDKMRVDMENLKRQVIKYHAKHGYWPTSLNELEGEYILKIPRNPEGKYFSLNYNSEGDLYIISISRDPAFNYSLFVGSL